MDKEVVEKYASEVPIELRNAVKALSDDRKWAVFVVLVKEGEKNFNNLKALFRAHPQELSRILKSLKSAGLIRRYVFSLEDVEKVQKTFYEPTEFGKEFLESLYFSIMPKKEIIKEVQKMWISTTYWQLDSTPSSVEFNNINESSTIPAKVELDSPKLER